MKKIDWRKLIIFLSPVITFYLGLILGIISVDNIQIEELIKITADLGTSIAGIAGIISIVLIYVTFKSQIESAQAQQFDTTFFSLLENFNTVRAKTDFSDLLDSAHEKIKEVKGLHYMQPVVDINTGKLRSSLSTEHRNFKKASQHDMNVVRKEFSKLYVSFYETKPNELGHYFRNVYNILKYINDYKAIAHSIKITYINLFKAQLSTDELGLIFYNAISDIGRNGEGKMIFRKLLDDWQFLENIDPSSIAFRWHHWYYPKTKFQFLKQSEIQEKDRFQSSRFYQILIDDMNTDDEIIPEPNIL